MPKAGLAEGQGLNTVGVPGCESGREQEGAGLDTMGGLRNGLLEQAEANSEAVACAPQISMLACMMNWGQLVH